MFHEGHEEMVHRYMIVSNIQAGSELHVIIMSGYLLLALIAMVAFFSYVVYTYDLLNFECHLFTFAHAYLPSRQEHQQNGDHHTLSHLMRANSKLITITIITTVVEVALSEAGTIYSSQLPRRLISHHLQTQQQQQLHHRHLKVRRETTPKKLTSRLLPSQNQPQNLAMSSHSNSH